MARIDTPRLPVTIIARETLHPSWHTRDHIDQRVQPWAAFQAGRGHRHAQGIARIHRVFVRLCTLVQVRVAGGIARAQVGIERRLLAQGGFQQGIACDGGRAVRVGAWPVAAALRMSPVAALA